MKGGDFDQSALAAMVAANADRVGDIVGTWKRISPDYKTAAFGVDQADASRIAEGFNLAGVNATTVFDETSAEDRQRIWRDFSHGDLRVICSVGVIGRGWDQPICKCIIDAAGTASIQKALQRWGRASRPYPGYKSFRLHDHAGNIYRHGCYEWDRVWSLDGDKKARIGDGEPAFNMTTCKRCKLPFKSGPRQCPRCGHAIPINERGIQEIDGELQAIKPEDVPQKPLPPMANADWSEKRKKYNEYMQIASEKGYQDKWVFLAFLKAFGHPPPKKWSMPSPPEIREALNNWGSL